MKIEKWGGVGRCGPANASRLGLFGVGGVLKRVG